MCIMIRSASHKLSHFLLLAALTFARSAMAGSAVVTWTNGTGDNNWNTPGNWSPSGVPGNADTAKFTSTTVGTVNVNAAVQVNIVEFDASGYLLQATGGGSITLVQPFNAGGFTQTNTATGKNTVSCPVTNAMASGTFTVDSPTGILDFTGPVSTQNGNKPLVIGDGSANEGQVIFEGNDSGFTAALTIATNGTLVAGSATALGTGGLTINSGGTLDLQGGFTIAGNITANGTGVSGAGAINNISGNNALSGTIALATANPAVTTSINAAS